MPPRSQKREQLNMNVNYKGKCSIFFILVLQLSSNASAAGDFRIDVIHNDQYMITGVQDLILSGVNVNVFNLDDPQKLIGSFKKSLSQNASLEQNKAIIMDRFNQMNKYELKQKFLQAYQGANLSMKQGVSHFPAILFNNGQSVIYGVTHLPTAVDIYNKWHNKRVLK